MWISFSVKPITMSTVIFFAKYRRVRNLSEYFALNYPDGVDPSQPSLSVLDVYDNPHIISFFQVDIPLLKSLRRGTLNQVRWRCLRTVSIIEGELQCSSKVHISLFVKTGFQSAGWRMFNPSTTVLSPHPLRSRSADFGEQQNSYDQSVMTLFTFTVKTKLEPALSLLYTNGVKFTPYQCYIRKKYSLIPPASKNLSV